MPKAEPSLFNATKSNTGVWKKHKEIFNIATSLNVLNQQFLKRFQKCFATETTIPEADNAFKLPQIHTTHYIHEVIQSNQIKISQSLKRVFFTLTQPNTHTISHIIFSVSSAHISCYFIIIFKIIIFPDFCFGIFLIFLDFFNLLRKHFFYFLYKF